MNLNVPDGNNDERTVQQQIAIGLLTLKHTERVQFGCCSGSCPQGFIVDDPSENPLPLRIIDDEGNQVKMTRDQFKVLIDSYLSLEE